VTPGAIETPRLRGEPPSAQHLEALAVLWGDPAVAAWLWPGQLGGPRTGEQVAAMLAEELEHWRRHGFGMWVFYERASGALVGCGGLRRGDGGVEVLYSLVSPQWGRGYATEIAQAAVAAAAALGLAEVVGYALPANVASLRVLTKAGLRFEGQIERAGLTHLLGRRRLAR
jgi:ribosomal-protein-alanine N-acetyltransferase